MRLLIVLLVFLFLLLVRFMPACDVAPVDRDGLPLPTCNVAQFSR